MFLQFLKIFFRNNFRYRLVSGINTLGLVLGLLSTMMILEYVLYERSFENFNRNSSRVYRLVYNRYQEGKVLWRTANSFSASGYYLKKNYAEVEDFAIITMNYNVTVSHENQSKDKVFYNEEKTYYATSSVFILLDIPVISGDRQYLEEPHTVAISERMAKRYFGDDNPLGKNIWVNYRDYYTVKAVFKTIPENSHLKSDFFFSFRTLFPRETDMINNWMGDYFHTYLMLKPGTDYRSFEAKALPEMVRQNYQDVLNSRNQRDDYYLQPIRDIHLKSNIEYETEQPVNGNMVSILFGFSVFFLIVAWINYINMVTARAIERAHEVGIKKVNGAKKVFLIAQFVGEAFLLNTLCLLIAISLFVVLNPYFASFTGIQVHSPFEDPDFLIIAAIIFVSGILLTSLYPAFVLSSYRPIEVLKGKLKGTARGLLLRKSLVTVQFMVSLMLLTGTYAAYRQVRFLDSRDMGIHYRSTVAIRAPQAGDLAGQYGDKLQVFKNQISQIPAVEEISLSSDIPGREINHWAGGYRKGYTADDTKEYFNIRADNSFLDFYRIKLLAGRKFERNELPEQHNIILNASAMKRFGFSDPEKALNEIMVDWSGKELKIIGVTEDFYFYSKKIEPVPTIISPGSQNHEFMSVRLNSFKPGELQPIITRIRDHYETVFPDRPFEYYFLEDEMKKDLKPDNTFISIFGSFSAIAILIAVIGILGLVLIIINQSMKELAVRKALGANLAQIGRQISRQLIWPFVIALATAIPLSWYVLKHWILNNYVHHIQLTADIFVLPVLLIVLVVFLILAMVTLKVNRIEISRTLQYE